MPPTYEVDMTDFPAEFMSSFNHLSDKAKEKWKQDRYRALTDGIYLGTEVMEGDFQEVPHRWLFNNFLKKRPGVPLYDLDLKKKKRLILWSRGLFKTSATIVEIVQLILNYPGIRICFLTGGDTLAARQLERVKKHFEYPSAKFKQLFPEFCGRKLGTKKYFNIPNRPRTNMAEPTMAITTAKSVKAGSHYDVIFVDDLVNDQNYRSLKALEACKQDYKDICPLLAPDGFIYVTGTRYSFGDLYEEIQDLIKKEIQELGTNPWKVSIKSCWVKVCRTCGHKDIEHDFDSNLVEHPCGVCDCKQFVDSGATQVLFPKFRCRDGRTEGHSPEFLQSEELRLGKEFFACQYLNTPLAADDQTFSESLLGAQTLWYDSQFPSALQASCFICGDLSYVGDEKRDISVLYVVRYYQGSLYQVDCNYGKWDSMQVAQQLALMTMKHRPTMIWLERFMGWEAYNTVFEIFARDNGIQKMPIEWKKMSNQADAKNIRIGGIKGILAQQRLWLHGGSPGYDKLKDQLLKFPKSGGHDDFADCLGLVCECPTGFQSDMQSIQPREAPTTANFIRSLHASNDHDFYDTRIPGTY
jgi:hypothetical protein